MDPIRRDLEEKLARTAKELQARIDNNPVEEKPASWSTIFALLGLVIVLGTIYIIMQAGG